MSLINITVTNLHHDSGARVYIAHFHHSEAKLHLMTYSEHTELGIKESFVYSSKKKEDILFAISERERIQGKCGYIQMSRDHEQLDIDVTKDINRLVGHYEKLLGLRRTREILERLQKAPVEAQGNYVIKTAQQGVW